MCVQRFLLFATGSSSLPPGGLRNLHPHFTIVRKGMEDSAADDTYPSVNTCVPPVAVCLCVCVSVCLWGSQGSLVCTRVLAHSRGFNFDVFCYRCVHYIKLPIYSKQEVMKERLLTAMQNTGFHLN